VIEAIALFAKDERREIDVSKRLADVGFDVFGFVVGYNIDYDNLYREVRGLWLVKFWPDSWNKWWDFFFPKKPVRLSSPI
jgi:hypothetical protein